MQHKEKVFLHPERVEHHLGIREHMKVADFGSGSGEFALIAARHVGQGGLVSAVDIRQGPLRDLEAKAKLQGLSNIETIRADLEKAHSSGLADNSQDVVLLITVLFQSKHPLKIVAEALRVLKPRGRLVLIDWEKENQGFGPPQDLRHAKETLQGEVVSHGSTLVEDFDAGSFHYGLIFIKNA